LKRLVAKLKSAFARRKTAATARSSSIIRTIHIVWIGDENKRPDKWIDSWRQKNPAWTVRVWGNQELTSLEWENHKHISEMLNRAEWPGVADMMRWEILYKYGGFAVDADSICIRPLEDWLFEAEVFACWENEIIIPGLIANGYVYSHPGNPLIREIIDDIYEQPSMSDTAPAMTGPLRLTRAFRRLRYSDLTIYPSHFFIPSHYRGLSYNGSGPVFARQFWLSTRQTLAQMRAQQAKPDGG